MFFPEASENEDRAEHTLRACSLKYKSELSLDHLSSLVDGKPSYHIRFVQRLLIMDRMFGSPGHACVDILTPKVVVLGGRSRGGSLDKCFWLPYSRDPRGVCPSCREDTARTRKGALTRHRICRCLDLGLSSLQKLWEPGLVSPLVHRFSYSSPNWPSPEGEMETGKYAQASFGFLGGSKYSVGSGIFVELGLGTILESFQE